MRICSILCNRQATFSHWKQSCNVGSITGHNRSSCLSPDANESSSRPSTWNISIFHHPEYQRPIVERKQLNRVGKGENWILCDTIESTSEAKRGKSYSWTIEKNVLLGRSGKRALKRERLSLSHVKKKRASMHITDVEEIWVCNTLPKKYPFLHFVKIDKRGHQNLFFCYKNRTQVYIFYFWIPT